MKEELIKFKPGDIIKCISSMTTDMPFGSIYTIEYNKERSIDPYIRLRSGHIWHIGLDSSRFELYKPIIQIY